MKSLRFERLELLSTQEKRARRIDFHPKLTVIKGENDVGKSSVIKSLFWAFGASSKTHPTWKAAKVKALVTFTIDGVRHHILRDGTRVGLFTSEGNVLLSTTSITSGLGPVFADLTDFGLVLMDKNGVIGTPPPAFAFLPFYVDQDNGWGQALQSFDNLQQYPSFRKGLIEFHSGIRANEYYKLTAEKRQLSVRREELVRDRKAIENAVQKLGLETTFSGLELLRTEHEQSLDQLLGYLRDLRVIRQKRAADLVLLVDEREVIKEQTQIARTAAQELSLDFNWISAVDDPTLLCPTCGTVHRNDFANKFSIVDDREACAEFLRDCHDRMRAVAHETSKIEAQMKETDDLAAEIDAMLQQRRGDVTLEELIKSESRRSAKALLDAQIEEISKSINERAAEIAEIEDTLKDFEKGSRRRKKIIEGFYAGQMLSFLRKLDVRNIDHAAASKIDKKIDDTGSDQPRAVLAYYLALMRTIFEFSSSLTAPMVIDSPNQQDQDANNVAAMIDLIISSRPDDGQTILGTVSLYDRKIEDGKVITLMEKGAVLASEEYQETADRFEPFFESMMEDTPRDARFDLR